TFPGTTPFLSAAIVKELRQTGRAALTLLVVPSFLGFGGSPEPFSGTVTRIETAPVNVPIIVNGRQVDLPTIHAKATLKAGAGTKEVDVPALADPDTPTILRWRDGGRASKVVKLEFPAGAGGSAVEHGLAERRKVDVYGIYFNFGSATIRPESERELKEIADVLLRNAEWKLRVDGHTDNIGTAGANLELSRRRSAAGKEALVSRYKIAPDRLTSGGVGAGAPKATNDTPEGRALNRRVELTRQ